MADGSPQAYLDDDSGEEADGSPTPKEDELSTEAWLEPTAEHVPQLFRCTTRLAERSTRLWASKRQLASAFEGFIIRRKEYDEQCVTHLQEQERCRKVLQSRVKALEAEQAELRTQAEELQKERREAQERSKEAATQQQKADQRIGRLMDQMVKLLAVNPSVDPAQDQVQQVLTELQAGNEQLVSRLCSVQQQLEEARRENLRAAQHLSDEQQRTKNLHDELCRVQFELFGSRIHDWRKRSWSPGSLRGGADGESSTLPTSAEEAKSDEEANSVTPTLTTPDVAPDRKSVV